jgi:hypothetical protein
MKKLLSILIALLLLTARPALAMVVWDFEDGTTQGWSLNGSGFTLTNPGSFAQLTDTSSGVDGGLAFAPLLGDLSGYASISWDALLPENWNFFLALYDHPVTLLLTSNTADYVYTPSGIGEADKWQSWQAPLVDGPGWKCTDNCTGAPDLFAQVLADNSVQIAFDLEVTNRGSSFSHNLEAGLDNVKLNPIPVPPAVWLFGSGLLGLIGVARRRKS